MAQDPANPTDPSPTAARPGPPATGQFRSRSGGAVECLTCGHVIDAHRFAADDVTRLEGASDPDDLLMVVPLRCPNCGTAGTLTLPYGPRAGPEDEAVVQALSRQPEAGTDSRPATATRIVVVTDDDESPSLDSALRWAIDLAHDTAAELVLYDRSAETWTDTPHPSGLLPADADEVRERPHLRAQLAPAAERGVRTAAWLATLPSLGSVATTLAQLEADVVVLPESTTRRIADRALPGSGTGESLRIVEEHSRLPRVTIVEVSDDQHVTVHPADLDA